MASTCSECGQQLSRFKTNNGHMDSCPTLYENQPSVGKGRKPKYHEAKWQKNGTMNDRGTRKHRWRCVHCGVTATTVGDSDPGAVRHRGAVEK